MDGGQILSSIGTFEEARLHHWHHFRTSQGMEDIQLGCKIHSGAMQDPLLSSKAARSTCETQVSVMFSMQFAHSAELLKGFSFLYYYLCSIDTTTDQAGVCIAGCTFHRMVHGLFTARPLCPAVWATNPAHDERLLLPSINSPPSHLSVLR